MGNRLTGTTDIPADGAAGPSSATAAVAAHAISDTLRIPLAARALGDALFPEVAVHDASARDALARLGDDGSLWLKQRATVYGVLSRTCVFRDLALVYLKVHPAGRDAAPVFLMSEGVLMYLPPAAVSAILAEFGERAPAGSAFVFDAMCRLAAAHRVMEGYGLPYSILGPMFRGLLRVPLYALYELRAGDA